MRIYVKQINILAVLLCIIAACHGCKNNSVNLQRGDNTNNDITYVFNPEPNEGNLSDGSGDGPGVGPNPICLATPQGVDGPGEFLWKPFSDSDGRLVILFPAKYNAEFSSVAVVNASIGTIEQCRFAGFANGNRQHWRCPRSGDAYTGRVVAESVNGSCLWQVSNPAIRQD